MDSALLPSFLTGRLLAFRKSPRVIGINLAKAPNLPVERLKVHWAPANFDWCPAFERNIGPSWVFYPLQKDLSTVDIHYMAANWCCVLVVRDLIAGVKPSSLNIFLTIEPYHTNFVA